jgi:hypothetical protein
LECFDEVDDELGQSFVGLRGLPYADDAVGGDGGGGGGGIGYAKDGCNECSGLRKNFEAESLVPKLSYHYFHHHVVNSFDASSASVHLLHCQNLTLGLTLHILPLSHNNDK